MGKHFNVIPAAQQYGRATRRLGLTPLDSVFHRARAADWILIFFANAFSRLTQAKKMSTPTVYFSWI